jgi:hypothetical protein
MIRNKRFFVTVSNRDPELPPSENLGSDVLPHNADSDIDLVKHLYREHKDVLPGKLTVQHIPSFKLCIQVFIEPNKERGRLKSLTGRVLQNKSNYYLSLTEKLSEDQEFKINQVKNRF